MFTENRVALRRMIHRTVAEEIRENQGAILTLLESAKRENGTRKARKSALERNGRLDRMVIHDASGVMKPSEHSRDRGADRDRFRLSIAEPLRIAGPRTVDQIDELFAALYAEAPWLREVIEFLWRSAREGVTDPSGFRLPPVLLIGPPGCGKTHLARRLGEL